MLGAVQRATRRGCGAGLGALIGAVVGWLVGVDLAVWMGVSGGAAAASLLEASDVEGRSVPGGLLAAVAGGGLAALGVGAALGAGWLPEVSGVAGGLDVVRVPWGVAGLAAALGCLGVRAAESALWALGSALKIERGARAQRESALWDGVDHAVAGLVAGLLGALAAAAGAALWDRTLGPLLGAAVLGLALGALRCSPPGAALRWGVLLGSGPLAGRWVALDPGEVRVFGGPVEGVDVPVAGADGLVAQVRCDAAGRPWVAPFSVDAVRLGGAPLEGEGADLAPEHPIREGQRIELGGIVGRVYRRRPWRLDEVCSGDDEGPRAWGLAVRRRALGRWL